MWLLKIKRLCSWFERLEINFWLAKPSQFLAWIPFKYILSLYYLSSLFVSGHHHITPWLLKSFSFSFYLSYSKPPFPQLYKKYWFFFSYFPNFKRMHIIYEKLRHKSRAIAVEKLEAVICRQHRLLLMRNPQRSSNHY